MHMCPLFLFMDMWRKHVAPGNNDLIREEPLMICWGARAKAGKKLKGHLPGKKKLIGRLARKKNSTLILCPSPPPDH